MAATDAAPLVVCDAGPLIHLDESSCLDLLADFSDVLATLRELPARSTLHLKRGLLDEVIREIERS